LDERATSSDGAEPRRRVRLVSGGIEVGGEVIPLYAGSVHYWRLDPRDHRACLVALRDLGLRLVDVYVPWSVHEIAPGVLEVGQSDPRRDVVGFLRLAHELGLYAILRPGPHINAELTLFGLPERVVWDPACQARSPGNNPVLLPMVPVAFPVPSYASEAFLDEVTRYFETLGPALAPLRYPNGPIVLVQIDNEGALYFRDGAYDQDYHPDAITRYRAFLRDKYRTIGALTAAYARHDAADAKRDEARAEADDEIKFATIEPPRRFDAESTADLARHLDWCQFHEHLLAMAIERFSAALARAGLSGLPTTHNLPMGQEATPLNAARVGRAVDLVGLDYYYDASPRSRAIIARRTTELAVRCEATGVPAFACEMGAGFPPFFPPLEEGDSEFSILTALAYSLRGFNLYMAVERDRWIGAPIDARGRVRPSAAFFRKLVAALEATRFHALTRRTPVRLLTPRSERRIARVMHAFGPVPGALFSIIGAGAPESCLEDDLGLGYPVAVEAHAFLRTFELALEARGVPVAHVGGEDRDVSLEGASWIVCGTAGALHPGLFERLEAAARGGARVTLGPRAPVFDGAMRPLAEPLDLERLRPPGGSLPLLVADDPAAADAAVAQAIQELALPTFACDPDGVHAAVHEDAVGRPRVLFVMNPGGADVVARVAVGPTVTRATDPIDGASFDVRRGAVEVRMQPRTARLLALD
jgi:beta-galactosidase